MIRFAYFDILSSSVVVFIVILLLSGLPKAQTFSQLPFTGLSTFPFLAL